MRSQDNARFSEMLAMMSETYKPFSDAKEKIWAALFRSYKIEDFEAAIFKHMSDQTVVSGNGSVRGSFEPKPADILKHMPEVKELLVEDKGGLSWCDKTQELINKYLPSNRPQNIKVNK